MLALPADQVLLTAGTPLGAGGFVETEQGEIRFPEISTPVLETVIKYFYYKVRRGVQAGMSSC